MSEEEQAAYRTSELTRAREFIKNGHPQSNYKPIHRPPEVVKKMLAEIQEKYRQAGS